MNSPATAASCTACTPCELPVSPERRFPIFDDLEAMARVAFQVHSAELLLSEGGEVSAGEHTCCFRMDVPLMVVDRHQPSADGRSVGWLRLSHPTPREDLEGSGYPAVERFADLVASLIAKTNSLREDLLATELANREHTDALTGLPTQAALLRKLQDRIDNQNEHPRHFALLYVDIDFFKRINDSLGHLVADALLIEVGSRIEETVQALPDCTVARLGGDEFAILLGDVTGHEDAMTYAAMLEYLLRKSIPCAGQEVFISASVGIAFSEGDIYTEAAQMLEDSDVAMSRAKRLGKAQCVIFSEKMRERAKTRLQLESDLREALREGQFDVHYQPKVRLDTGLVKGFEALVRWRHPVRGPVSPADFIPVAEDTGLINEIGRLVAEKAIRQMARWRQNRVVPPDATMAVNLSPSQFHDPELLAWILAELSNAGLPAANLVLEVTESLIVEDAKSALVLLNAIVAEGIGLDLDDFGTGYSSLSYLHRFPFRCLKIDRSFISQMCSETKSESLVATIVGLARSMQMGVIAEGVETEAQCATLRRMGCNVAQGFLYSPAKPAAELEVMLARDRGILEPRPVPQSFRPPALSGERLKTTSGIHYSAAFRFRGEALGAQKSR